MKLAIAQDFCAQAGIFLEKFFRPRNEGDIHPFARCAMLGSSKLHALHLELTTDERKNINSGDDDVAAQHPRRFLLHYKVGAEPLKNLRRKEFVLALVIFTMIKVAIPAQTLARNTLDSVFLD
jgi:hypothetical protein